MKLQTEHLATILKVYPKAILTPIILGKVSAACCVVSKEYAKGFVEWCMNCEYVWLEAFSMAAWVHDDFMPRNDNVNELQRENLINNHGITTDQLQSLYEEHAANK